MSNGDSLKREFDRQIDNLVQKEYPDWLGKSIDEFRRFVEPLKVKITNSVFEEVDLERGILPFVVVIKSEKIGVSKMMKSVEREGEKGVVKLDPVEPEKFEPIEGLFIPEDEAYLILDINRGKETLNITPEKALKLIIEQERFPLTIEEGIAVITHYPDFLKKNHCFSLLGSRTGDQRVPAMWISEKNPKLGWCWDRNPHTWLGSASCGGRVGV